MPKSSPIQTNFSGGELGPLIEGRVDIEKYATGLEQCLNYLPTIEGPLVRRPGTKRVASVKDPSKPPVFIPFKITNAEQYIIEAGENYFRFFTDEGQVVTSGTSYTIANAAFSYAGTYGIASDTEAPFYAVRTAKTAKTGEILTGSGVLYTKVNFVAVPSGSAVELPTIYDHNMIQNVSWTQKGDTLFILHSSIPTFSLQRFGPQDWDLKYFATKDGPYLPLNSYKSSGDALTTQIRVMNIVDEGTDTFIVRTHSSITIANIVQNTSGIEVWTSAPHKKRGGDKVWINGVFGSTEANNGSSFVSGLVEGRFFLAPRVADSSVWTVQVVTDTSLLLVNSVYANAYVGSGTIYPALFTPQDQHRNLGLYINGHRYFGYVIGGSSLLGSHTNQWIHPIQVRMGMDYTSRKDTVAAGSISGSTVTTAWQMGSYNDFNGFPSSATFHQNRLVLNSAPGRPTEFNASKSGEYELFNVNQASSLSVIATNALQFSLVSGSNDFLEWVESSSHGLYFASRSAEFLVSASREGEALTPTNVSNEIISTYGTSEVDPIRFGDAIIYVQNAKRKVRELRFFENLQSHKSTQINQISDHITYPSILGMTVQKETYPSIWGYKSDGRAISLSYSREDTQAIFGWAGHELGGRSDSSESVPKIKALQTIRDSTGKYDQLWMAVQRFINGTSTVEVEYMTEPYRHRDNDQKQRDSFYVDCGATYDSSLVISSITTGSALVTVTNHGLSRNDLVLISDVVGINSSLLDINQVIVNSNLVNDRVFVVGSTTANNFFLQDFNSSIIITKTYSPYFSGGKARKLVSTIGGLTWLKNEEVDILGDGGYQGKQTVNSAGVLTLTNPAAVVQVGYAYKSRAKTLIKENGSATGSAVGMNRKTYQVAFRVRDVGDLRYSGIGFHSMHEANFAEGDLQQTDAATPLYTGIYRDGVEGDVELYSQVFFEQKTPLPGMIQSITYMMDEYDL